MKKIAIVTDSNSGITQQEAKELGIYVIPMPFYINDEVYFEDINLTQEEFYQHLAAGAEISTSMPAIGDVTDLWDSLLKEYDEIVHIPMSSGLSSTCSTTMVLAEEYGGRVVVVDNKRISVTQKQAALDAKRMAALGWDALQIREKLLETMYDASIYITLDTLYYLKKGGRVTPAVAAIGTLLRIKPVLQIQGDKLDAFANARTKKRRARSCLMLCEKTSGSVLAWKIRWRTFRSRWPIRAVTVKKYRPGEGSWRRLSRKTLRRCLPTRSPFPCPVISARARSGSDA